MKRILLMLAVAAFMVAALTITSVMAFAAAKQCEQPTDPGCKERTTTTKPTGGTSGGFTREQEQRGRIGAPGTLDTLVSGPCIGPSGKELNNQDNKQCRTA